MVNLPLVHRKTRRGLLRLVFLSILLTSLSGCSQPVQNDTSAQLTSQEINHRYEQLIGDNDLLISPDFWGSLYISYEGEIAYRLMNDETLKETWPHTPKDTFELLEESTDSIGAAYIIVEFDLFDDYTFLTSLLDIHEQWNTVNKNDQEAIFTLFALQEIASACDIDLTVTDTHKEIVFDALSSEFTVEQKWAQELANTWDMHDIPDPNPTSDFLMAEEIPYALWSDYRLGVPYSKVDTTLVDSAINTRFRSDSANARLYGILIAYSDTKRAEKVRQSFNTHRVLSDGTILEMPVFNGTLDSTFYMARYMHETGKLSLDSRVQEKVVETLRKNLHGTSKSDALLAAASLAYIDSKEIDDVDRDNLYHDFLKEAELESLLDGHRLDFDDLFTWVRISPYLKALDIDLTFSGMSKDAEKELAANPEETVILACELIIALHDLGILEDFPYEKDIALSTIESYVDSRSANDLATSVVMEIELTYSYAGKKSPFSDFNLSQLIEDRSGQCVGGYTGFLKEFPGNAPCTVEGTRYAYHLDTLRKEQ